MSLVARAYPDAQFIDADGRARADAVVIRSSSGETLSGELAIRHRSPFPIPATLDEAVAAAGYQRSGSWRRSATDAGDEWEAQVVTLRPRRMADDGEVQCS
jgi:hypothetical protein